MPKTYRWYVAIVPENQQVNRRIFEETGYDDTNFHKETDCFDRRNLEIVRDLYELPSEKVSVAKSITETFKVSIQIFVQEGNGKIRWFDPRAAKRKVLPKLSPMEVKRRCEKLLAGVH